MVKTHAGECEITHERKPLMELERFKIICFLAGFALYVGMVCAVSWLCGFWALLWLWGFTAALVLVWMLT